MKETGPFICKTGGIYLLPTISYIHPDKDWPYHKLEFTFLKRTVGVIWS